MYYDVIIIGAGAAGLFAAASMQNKRTAGEPFSNAPPSIKGLILEKTKKGGTKILMSGGGQCNLSHGGKISDFIFHYGEKGKKIRPLLYKYNNIDACSFFETNGVPLYEREDGKIFPQSRKAQDIVDCLISCAKVNEFKIAYEHEVLDISLEEDMYKFRVSCAHAEFFCKNLIIATGGASYSSTGSDGAIFEILKKLTIAIEPLKPALVPLIPEAYPYAELSGISLDDARLTIKTAHTTYTSPVDSLLFTHTNFSGPLVLNSSRYAEAKAQIIFDYAPEIQEQILLKELQEKVLGSSKIIRTIISELTRLQAYKYPKRFIDALCLRAEIKVDAKASTLAGAQLKKLCGILKRDTFTIKNTAGFSQAMVSSGGVLLEEVDLKTLECKKIPGLFIVGEALNVDGDTGGYNLQFAWSSAHAAACALATQ